MEKLSNHEELIPQTGWTTHSPIEDWHDFAKLVDRIIEPVSGEKHHFLFRGQADAGWNLQPSIVRMLSGINISPAGALQIEDETRKEFTRQVHLHLDTSLLQDGSQVSLWSLMQHHRAPTRLLDWSSSPYVACYFAVESLIKENGAIWITDALAMADRMRQKYPSYDRGPYQEGLFSNPNVEPQIFFFQPQRLSNRMIAQQGLSSVSTYIFSDHADIIAEALKGHSKRGWQGWNHKVVISAKCKEEFLGRLRSMNITANSLFPGIDGLGLSLREYIRIAGIQKAALEQDGKFPWYFPSSGWDWK